MPESKRQSFNVYQRITDSIVAAIEAGTGPVELPWHRSGCLQGIPKNALTGKQYRGVNVVALWAAAASQGFGSPYWATYRQWQQLGAQVRRHEKASIVVFYKQIEVASPEDEEEKTKSATRLMARASWAFNADQVEGFASPEELSSDPVTAVRYADTFVKRTGAIVCYGGDSAFYSITADLIRMPERGAFTGTSTSNPTEAFYGVLFHELTHWTGAKHRLCRDLFGRFGSDAYAMEELVAELGAAFLCAEFGISATSRADHAAYLGNWLEVLKADSRAIFSAASRAAEAVDYLSSVSASERTRNASDR